jgi:hypothetical protein
MSARLSDRLPSVVLRLGRCQPSMRDAGRRRWQSPLGRQERVLGCRENDREEWGVGSTTRFAARERDRGAGALRWQKQEPRRERVLGRASPPYLRHEALRVFGIMSRMEDTGVPLATEGVTLMQPERSARVPDIGDRTRAGVLLGGDGSTLPTVWVGRHPLERMGARIQAAGTSLAASRT